jgi:hypothetical protein
VSAQPSAGFVTTSTAMARLDRNREQIVKLVDAGLLPAPQRYGRARLIDPASLDTLAARRQLVDVGRPADDSGHAEPYALALHLGPRAPETDPHHGRTEVGWTADGATPDDAWTGWWNCGRQLADQVVAAGLPVLPAISGFVVDERVASGYTMHPIYPGLIQFDILAAPPAEEHRRRYLDTVFRPAPGPPYQLLWRPTRRAGAQAENAVGAQRHGVVDIR